MTQTMLNAVVKDTLITAAKVSAPILLVVLVLGVVISVLQASTQIQETTLSFVPKLIGAAVIGIFLGPWMLQTMLSFTNRIFELISRVVT
ncbi:flagellar biosynthetic protein FliQ [Clostridium sp. BL-8]|uniref:flagellar biosynthetic protein FliQ n=1 Tax=Clostridium sp. BL-8 TaxID=349938 RepID=UPI00098BFA69|nr:flagellar biosynthetic protein FliQ [Clostridium sp. BL-8]OOM79930.1 flagellar biosynthetic protein FliQ [Clostridium sp. BL-8]